MAPLKISSFFDFQITHNLYPTSTHLPRPILPHLSLVNTRKWLLLEHCGYQDLMGPLVDWCVSDFTRASLLLTLTTQTLGVAAYGDLKVDVPQEYKHFEDNKKPEFLAKFPHGKVPAFEGKDGFLLFELFAVARYCKCLISVDMI